MYYRLRPPFEVTWVNMPTIDDDLIAEHQVDLDKLGDEWKPSEDRAYSHDLLRIALRHGIGTRTGIAVDALHTVNLGHSDTLRVSQQAIDELQADLRASNGELLERLMPGWTQHGEELDERVRDSTEHAAAQADQDLSHLLAAPVKAELAEHWTNLGGALPAADETEADD